MKDKIRTATMMAVTFGIMYGLGAITGYCTAIRQVPRTFVQEMCEDCQGMLTSLFVGERKQATMDAFSANCKLLCEVAAKEKAEVRP